MSAAFRPQDVRVCCLAEQCDIAHAIAHELGSGQTWPRLVWSSTLKGGCKEAHRVDEGRDGRICDFHFPFVHVISSGFCVNTRLATTC